SAVNVITIHSAKGLEWPVVIPINACTGFGPRPRLLHRSGDDTLHWVIDDVASPSIIDARGSVEIETQLERERMWYVTCTRAEELLIIPEIPRIKYPTWSGIVDLDVGGLASFPVEQLTPITLQLPAIEQNEQTAEIFESQFAEIAARSVETRWVQPSAADGDRVDILETLMSEPQEVPLAAAPIGGGKIRGL